MEETVIVLMCNNVEKYIIDTARTLKELRENGKYNGDIVLIYDDELNDKIQNYKILQDTITQYNIILKYFPKIDRTKFIEMFNQNPFKEGDKREITKSFQFHKLYLFNSYLSSYIIDAKLYIQLCNIL